MKLFRRRRKNQFFTGVLVTCILCVFSVFLLAQDNDRRQSILFQYVYSNLAHSVLKRSRTVDQGRAINHSRPLIDFTVTIPPVLDESGYFADKVQVNVGGGKGSDTLAGDLAQVGNEVQKVKTVSIKEDEDSKAREQMDAEREPVKGNHGLNTNVKSEDLVDILDSKISQIPKLVDSALEAVPVDLDLADDFLQIHRALKPAPKKDNPIRILIVTNRRSGSSFLGQTLNQNPKIFFHFEPLKLLEKKPGIYANQSVFLSLLLSCKFKKMPFLMDFYNKERLHRSGSLALTSPPLCTLSIPINSTNVRQCDKLHPTFSASVCARYTHTAAKLIRLYNISSLEKLITQEDLNLKIIHLVRDPRGILSSRSRTEERMLNVDKSLDGEAGYLCRRMKSNLKVASSQPPWLKDRYKLVRYEDIAYDPERWVGEIYKFAGLGPIPSEVLSWIRINTNLQSSGKYSTSRDSKETAEAWRKHLSLPVAKRIGEVCKDVFSLLKYQHVGNVEELSNMKESLVKPLPSSVL